MAEQTPTQLYLVVEIAPDAASVATLGGVLGAVLARRADRPGRVAAVLFKPAAGAMLDARIGPLVEVVQKQSVAALVASDARLARTLKADGVHLPASDDPLATYEEARDILGTRFIVGCDGTLSRHDAMSLGEAGAEYLGFGLGGDRADDGAAYDRRLELIAWWSEIFEVPCVALDIDTPEDAATLVAAGADFVALRLPADLAAADAPRWLDATAAALASPAAVT